jgi:hypothetical protein
LRVTEEFKRNAFANDPFLFLHDGEGYVSYRGNNVPVCCWIRKVKGKKTGDEINVERATEGE